MAKDLLSRGIDCSLLLEAIPFGIGLSTKDLGFSILNPVAKELLGADSLKELGTFTTAIIESLKNLQNGRQKKEKLDLMVPGKGIRKIQVTYSVVKSNLFLLTFRDITKELSFIEDYAFLKVEKEARSVLQKKKEEELERYKAIVNRLLSNLPVGVSFVSISRRVGINNLNRQKFFSQEEHEHCFEYLNRDEPCTQCRLEESLYIKDQTVVGHKLGGVNFTETIIPFEDESGALLVFRDTSRQVELIEKIRKQRDTIVEQKELFETMVKVMRLMQEEENPSLVAKAFLESLLHHTKASTAILIAEGTRRGIIMIEMAIGERAEVIEPIKNFYLSKPMRSRGTTQLDTLELKTISYPGFKWAQYPIVRQKNRQMGILFLEYPQSIVPPDDIITFFIEPFSGFVHNRILTLKLEEKAYTDALTGLYNRRYFDQVFDEEVKKATSTGLPFSIIMADANGLKYVNDTYGHEYGDKLIKAVAKVFLHIMRETDVVTRIGGDEFAAVLPNTGYRNALIVVERLKAEAEKRHIDLPGGKKYPISISFGCAGSDVHPLEEMIKSADEAMYKDKEAYYAARGKYR